MSIQTYHQIRESRTNISFIFIIQLTVMVKIPETEITRYGIRLNYFSMFIGVRIDLRLILKDPIYNISIEAADFSAFFVTNNIITIKSTRIKRLSHQFFGLVLYRR